MQFNCISLPLTQKGKANNLPTIRRLCGSVVVYFSSVASLIFLSLSLSFTYWCPQCPDLTTPTHTQLHSTIYCYLHPQLLLLLLLLWLFLLLFLVVFPWSNISFRPAAVVLVKRDVVKERNTAKTERQELEAVTEVTE